MQYFDVSASLKLLINGKNKFASIDYFFDVTFQFSKWTSAIVLLNHESQ